MSLLNAGISTLFGVVGNPAFHWGSAFPANFWASWMIAYASSTILFGPLFYLWWRQSPITVMHEFSFEAVVLSFLTAVSTALIFLLPIPVGGVANEAGMESRNIRKVSIHDDYSTVELPADMPPDVLQHLKKVWVCGRPLQISASDGGAGTPPRRKTERAHEEPKSFDGPRKTLSAGPRSETKARKKPAGSSAAPAKRKVRRD